MSPMNKYDVFEGVVRPKKIRSCISLRAARAITKEFNQTKPNFTHFYRMAKGERVAVR